LYTKRNLWALAAIREAAMRSEFPSQAMFAFTGVCLALSRMQRYSPNSGFPNMLLVGTYYLPQIGREIEAAGWYRGKLKSLLKGFDTIRAQMPGSPQAAISTADARSLDIPSDSVDYIFTDPPYGGRVQYGELNFVWESWLNRDTQWHDDELVINPVRGISPERWADGMKAAMAECFRVLKPGRWLSLCYHDSSNGTWQAIQNTMTDVGFEVDRNESTLFIDTAQKSFNQLTAGKATKRDLVFNYQKPRVPSRRRPRPRGTTSFAEVARSIIRLYLTKHPGSTTDYIYDHVVSRLVREASMESHNFDALLRSVAEERPSPPNDDVPHDKRRPRPGRTASGRWYLKETVSSVGVDR
jgi:hypothetical protein